MGSGLAEWALLGDSSGAAAAVIEPRRFAAAKNAEHALQGCLVGADQPAIALVGFAAAFQQPIQLVAAR